MCVIGLSVRFCLVRALALIYLVLTLPSNLSTLCCNNIFENICKKPWTKFAGIAASDPAEKVRGESGGLFPGEIVEPGPFRIFYSKIPKNRFSKFRHNKPF